MQRVWGGRELERVYGRLLPDPKLPFGESWEIVDRENEQSIVDEGPLSGESLHDLWTEHREEYFGNGYVGHSRFPILIKVLDARDDLSIQVHPPVDIAKEFGGDPKTEMWYIMDADPALKNRKNSPEISKAYQQHVLGGIEWALGLKPGAPAVAP